MGYSPWGRKELDTTSDFTLCTGRCESGLTEMIPLMCSSVSEFPRGSL